MKKGVLWPASVLAVILIASLWNGYTMKTDTERWQSQLQQAAAMAQDEDWGGALEVLNACYQDWSAQQTYLHIVSEHEAVDDAEAMYQRAIAFASTKESSEFQAETMDLRDQLRLLAETERFSVKNIL